MSEPKLQILSSGYIGNDSNANENVADDERLLPLDVNGIIRRQYLEDHPDKSGKSADEKVKERTYEDGERLLPTTV
jgi:hypothetical protein